MNDLPNQDVVKSFIINNADYLHSIIQNDGLYGSITKLNDGNEVSQTAAIDLFNSAAWLTNAFPKKTGY